jgi:hypothetical protein
MQDNRKVRSWPLLLLVFPMLLFPALIHAQGSAPSMEIPVTYYKLENGLKVVLSPDKTATTVGVGVYYNFGFRI